MTAPKPRSKWKAPPARVAVFRFLDGAEHKVQAAEILVRRIEDACRLREAAERFYADEVARLDELLATFKRTPNAAETVAEFNRDWANARAAAETQLLVAERRSARIRATATKRIQLLFELAAHHVETKERAGSKAAARQRTIAEYFTNKALDIAVNAAVGAGEKVTSSTVLNHWPGDVARAPSARQIQRLLKSRKP